jgi:hypothetical protein
MNAFFLSLGELDAMSMSITLDNKCPQRLHAGGMRGRHVHSVHINSDWSFNARMIAGLFWARL